MCYNSHRLVAKLIITSLPIPKKYYRPAPKKHYDINHYIRAEELRVIDEAGKQLGIMSKGEALGQAQERKLDLVLVTDKAKPPIAKIIDFSKFKYQQSKKTRSGTTKTKATDVKEIRFTPFMADNDFKTRLERAKGFLDDGHKVKLVVKFVGRQITRKEFGVKQMEKAISSLSDVARLEAEPKWQGKLYFAQIKPTGNPNEKNKDKD